MQTLEPTREPLTSGGASASTFGLRKVGLLFAAMMLVVGVAAAGYGIGRAQGSSKTIVGSLGGSPVSVTPVTIDDRGFSKLVNGHQAETSEFEAPLDPGARRLLQHQLTLARAAAMRYPTVADAEAAGWRRVGPFLPGLGAHFLNLGPNGGRYVPDGPITDGAILAPSMLIYDGTHPDSRIAGLMYLGSGLRIPQGFAGSNDIWHYHSDVCYVLKHDGGIDIPFGVDTSVPTALCNSVGGTVLQQTPYMLHVWAVAGYDSPQGVFSHDSEAMTCRDGTYHMIPMNQWGTRTSACVDGGE
jgi:hypothetical protein